MHPFFISRRWASAALVMLPLYVIGLYTLWLGHPSIAAENAQMEKVQASCLALACALFVPCLTTRINGFSRFVYWLVLLVIASMFLREVDVERLPVSDAIARIGGGFGRDLIVGSAFAVTFIILVRRRSELVVQLVEYAFSCVGVLMAFGVMLYVSSLPFDKSLFGLSRELNQFCEEAIECGATLMFLLASVANLGRFGSELRAKPAKNPTRFPVAPLLPRNTQDRLRKAS